MCMLTSDPGQIAQRELAVESQKKMRSVLAFDPRLSAHLPEVVGWVTI